MAKKAASKKTATKAASQQSAASATPAKKVAAKKAAAPATKAAASSPKATASATKTAVVEKKAPAKKAAVKKTPTAASTTTVVAKVDVGFGNKLFIRGEGAGLSWESGVEMTCDDSDEWSFEAKGLTQPLTFKVLVNDEVWADGENVSIEPGQTLAFSPTFGA